MSIDTKTSKTVIILSALLIIIITSIIFCYTQSYYKNFVRGERCFKQDKYDQALTYFISAFEEKPKNLEVSQYIVWTYAKLNRQQDVAKALQIMSEIDPGNWEAKKWLGDTYYGLDNFAKAEECYKDLLLVNRDFSLSMKLAEVLVWQKKYTEAIPVLKELLQQRPNDYQLIEFLADVYSWQKEYDEAIMLYKQLLSEGSTSKEIALKLAEILRFAGRDAEAAKIYNQYLKGVK